MLYNLPLSLLLLAMAVLLGGAMALGNWTGHRAARADGLGYRSMNIEATLAGAGLGLLALMLGFTFSMALTRYEARRTAVLEEANAIGTAWLRAGLLPAPERAQSRQLLADYARVRLALRSPRNPAAAGPGIRQSVALQDRLWALAERASRAAIAGAPGASGPMVGLYIAALNAVIDAHETRLASLRTHVPDVVMWVLIVVAGMVLGYGGHVAGKEDTRLRLANVLMAVMVACVIVLVMDLDRPERGLVQVSRQPLLDLVQGLSPPR